MRVSRDESGVDKKSIKIFSNGFCRLFVGPRVERAIVAKVKNSTLQKTVLELIHQTVMNYHRRGRVLMWVEDLVEISTNHP